MTCRKSYFNEAAKAWDSRYFTPKLVTFLEKLVPTLNLKLGDNVLDVGTGTGILIPFLLRVIGPSGTITAIDYAPQMIQICRAKYAHLKNVFIRLHDVENLHLPPQSFNAVTCFGLFPHLEHKERTLRSLNHVLKLGGSLIIAHALSSEEIRSHHTNRSLPVGCDVLPKKSQMKRLLKSTGYTQIQIKDEPGCYLCQSTKP